MTGRLGSLLLAFGSSLLAGAALTLLLVDYFEFLDQMTLSRWCEGVIETPFDWSLSRAIAFMWRCYDWLTFGGFALVFGAPMFALLATAIAFGDRPTRKGSS